MTATFRPRRDLAVAGASASCSEWSLMPQPVKRFRRWCGRSVTDFEGGILMTWGDAH